MGGRVIIAVTDKRGQGGADYFFAPDWTKDAEIRRHGIGFIEAITPIGSSWQHARMSRSDQDVKELQRIGENIQAARKQAALTQQQLADAIGVQVRAINKFERGKINIPSTTLLRIRATLKCRWEKLLGK